MISMRSHAIEAPPTAVSTPTVHRRGQDMICDRRQVRKVVVKIGV
jgi:hypothetical protein